jgi:outer membrane protein TolC
MFVSIHISAQTLELNNATLKLLPLQSLIDSALIHSPLLKQQDALISKKELLAQIEKRNWMNTLSLTGSAAYGTGNNLSLTNQGPVLTNTLTTQTTVFYNAGITFYLPIATIFNTKLKIKAAQEEVSYQQNKKEEVEQSIKQSVIAGYQELLLLDKKIALKTSKVNSYYVSKDLAYEQMRNGIIDVTDYNEVIEKYNAALIELEETKSQLSTSFYLLEILVGCKITKEENK